MNTIYTEWRQKLFVGCSGFIDLLERTSVWIVAVPIFTREINVFFLFMTTIFTFNDYSTSHVVCPPICFYTIYVTQIRILNVYRVIYFQWKIFWNLLFSKTLLKKKYKNVIFFNKLCNKAATTSNKKFNCFIYQWVNHTDIILYV